MSGQRTILVATSGACCHTWLGQDPMVETSVWSMLWDLKVFSNAEREYLLTIFFVRQIETVNLVT